MECFSATTRCSLLLYMSVCLSYCLDFELEYFTDITLTCEHQESLNEFMVNTAGTLMKQVWLLPNGHVKEKEFGKTDVSQNDTMHNDTTSKVFDLSIKQIDDEDFGNYLCLKVWDDYSVSIVKHSININGPVFASMDERHKHNAMVGGIAAGSMLVVCLILYVAWYFMCSEKVRRKKRLVEDLQKGVNRYSTQMYDNVGFEHYTKKVQD